MGLPVASLKRSRADRSPSPERYGEATSEVQPWHAVGEAHDWRALAHSAAKPSTAPSLSSATSSPGAHAHAYAHAPSAVEHGMPLPSAQSGRESGPGVSARVRLAGGGAGGAGGAGDQSPMERLDSALLLKIVQMAAPTAWDLCRMSCVSTAWRRTCAHSSFWTRLRVGSGSLRAGVEQLAPRCTGLQELFVDDPRCELHVLHPLIIACASSLRRVVIDCDRDATSPTRNEASVSSVLWLISLYCKNVESIELQSDGQEASIGLLEGRPMWYLTSAFRRLRYFACLARGALTRQAMYLAAIAWRDLECVRINIDGLETDDLLALRKCANLRALELVGGRLAPLQPLPAGGCPLPAGTRLATGAAPRSAERPEGSEGSSITSELQSWSGAPAEYPDERDAGAYEVPCGTPGGALRGPLGNAPGSAPGWGLGGPLAPLGVVFHPSLELLVLNRVELDAATAAALALSCPSLKRILVSGTLCPSCLAREGPCRSQGVGVECRRNQVDHIQHTLSQVRIALHA